VFSSLATLPCHEYAVKSARASGAISSGAIFVFSDSSPEMFDQKRNVKRTLAQAAERADE
jgi:hypothetical protein